MMVEETDCGLVPMKRPYSEPQLDQTGIVNTSNVLATFNVLATAILTS